MASFSALDPLKLSAIKLTTNRLGTGSYASVYEVNYLGLKCAGKKIHEVLLELEQSGEATYALTRFAEECRLLSRMRHPNIVQFLGVYFEKGMKVPVLIMEFLPTNLSSCIEHNGILRSEISYPILHDVSLGLNYLHSHSPPIIHRDLSSNNVLLAASMKAKISDLGVAKILNLTPLQVSRVVRNTETPGTGAYMPPEAMIANPSYNTSIDVFSYGVMMIHVFSGQWPEPQCAQIQMERGRMIPKSEAERRQKFLDMIGEKHPLMDLILRCIDNDPKRRPSANEVVPQLNDMVAKNPAPFSTRLEMLQRIDAKSEELQLARQEITTVEAEFKAFKDKQQAGYIEDETKTQQSTSKKQLKAPESVAMSVSRSKMTEEHYILMKDVFGEKAAGALRRMVGIYTSPKQIFRGELLRPISTMDILTRSSWSQLNFSIERDPNVTLQAIEDDVAPLGLEDYYLLLAVTSVTDRFRVFSDPQLLEWGEKLNVGQQVHVRLPSPNPMDPNVCLAIVRYKGFVKTHPGTMFGVEIKDERYRGKGTTDGFFQDEQYFTCDTDCGVIVSLDKLSYDTRPGDIQSEVQSQQSTNKPPSYAAGASHAQSQSQPSHSGKKGPSDIDPPRSRLKINDHVVVFDKHNTPLHGTVRWAGRKSRIGRDLGSFHVGIEMIMHINATDVPGAKTGLSDLFFTKKNHSIVIPESLVIAVEDYTEKRSSKEKYVEREMGIPPPYTPSPIAIARDPDLSVGSRIQIPTPLPTEPYKYGVIMWLGEVPAVQGVVAGIEMDEYMDGCTDGTLTSTGQKFFNCLPGRGIYYPLVNLQPDIRFTDPATVVGGEILENPLEYVPFEEVRDQHVNLGQIKRYIGEEKGIQGQRNSCYLDSTVFGLFAVSDAFDNMFLQRQQNDPAGDEVKQLLWKGIVNPLRKNGVVRHESVMRLRNKLEELGKMKGVNQDEKDPEEFLNMLFKHTLHVPPFVNIKRPFGVDQEYFVQLFVEPDDSLKLPTVEDLLARMFKEQKIRFTKVPSKLLIQIPRYGREFKTFKKTIPSLKLNLKGLLSSKRRCFICGDCAWNECSQCVSHFTSSTPEPSNVVYFCESCAKLAHGKTSGRDTHRITDVASDPGKINELDLLSVICIETSHYICFTRSDDRWVFFDSMANRVNDMYNIPKVVDCTDALNEWVYPASGDLSRLMNTPPRELPEYVRRFTQDIYLCVYIQPDVGMYGDFGDEDSTMI